METTIRLISVRIVRAGKIINKISCPQLNDVRYAVNHLLSWMNQYH